MAEGFEPYHVPQQSRRDKLRIVAQNHSAGVESTAVSLSPCSGLLPLYDASLLSSDLLSSAANGSLVCAGKEEGASSMGFVGGISSSVSLHHPYLDAQSSLPLNPSSIQDMNNHPFLYTQQNLQNIRYFDPSYNSATGQALSLSLSSHDTHQNSLPLELGFVVPSIIGAASASASATGYASILKGSRLLSPAQQLLEELCDVGWGFYSEKFTPDSSLMEPPPLQNLSATDIIDDGESRRKKSRLISMLDEVYRSYKQYYQQIQAVVASFEYVAGLGNAAPFANVALKAMSKHFKCLKKAITDQLQFINEPHGPTSPGKDERPVFGSGERSLYNRAVHNSGFHEHQPVWRPQRGLPERAVTVLRAWLFEHFLHPYPTDTDKLMLAKQTGLSRNQVSNWFINARVRLWKPMVEEIHTLEQAQKGSEDQNSNKLNDHMSSMNSLAPENPSTSIQRAQDMPSKRTRSEPLADIPLRSEPLNLSSYNSMSSHPHVGMAGGSNGVSLTLGLHQNNSIGLSEPFPMNAAQHFGLGLSSEGYVIGGYEAQNRHFGRDVIGGQLLHDFVG
ncbi:BEL1-like homeodomain protein 2 [Hibiscus syriacus]|uniref:BEL1-like homeodomain protein 2 n=1 Tax=Hibiscus syriacus TaxID=106335 RepID=A0A6A2ZZN3_HIBSY|nr:BEL1-like homeodomain protein 9 [Hibiscus syriacus]KAE8696552.1 BEL1-like homeodomain protein 2 [Hibiscus syriacus]